MGNFEEVKEIGCGSFGVARLLRNKKTRELVAVKYIQRGPKVLKFTLIQSLNLVRLRFKS